MFQGTEMVNIPAREVSNDAASAPSVIYRNVNTSFNTGGLKLIPRDYVMFHSFYHTMDLLFRFGAWP